MTTKKAAEVSAEETKKKPAAKKAAAPKAKKTAEKPAKKPAAKKTAAAKTEKKPAAKKPAARKPRQTAAPAEPRARVLFLSSEVAPFAASGGLADVAGSLPIALNEQGCDVRVMMPLYAKIGENWRSQMKFLCWFFLPVGWRNQYCGLFELQHRGTTYYFLDNEYYFKRDALYGYDDDGERFAFFSRACLEAALRLDFQPTILHCNDWQTALVPAYLRFYRDNPKLASVKTLFTIHNIEFQGKYGDDCLSELFGLRAEDHDLMHWNGCLNLMKGAIELADKVNTVSPTYARELMDPWFSFGLDSLLRDKQYKFCGILNGIDTVTYNPETDPNCAAPFSAADAAGKAACKKALLAEFGMQEDGRPVVAMITRLTAQKGLDLVCCVLDEIVGSGAQLLVLGTGDWQYEECLRQAAQRHAGSCGVRIAFLPQLSKRMYAGADLFLMPSKTEPCGLAQMMALRYGTLPIVRQTGGLADSIRDCGDGEGNGFTFQTFNAHDMLDAVRRAVTLYYQQPEQWAAVRERAMRCDFSWNSAAGSYLGLYDEMNGRK